MKLFLTELKASWLAGNHFNLCRQDNKNNNESINETNNTKKEILFALACLTAYGTPLTFALLSNTRLIKRALQLTMLTLSLLSLENLFIILNCKATKKYLKRLSQFNAQLEAQLLPLFFLQAIVLSTFINKYHIHQAKDDTPFILIQHIPSALACLIRHYLLGGAPHPKDTMKEAHPITNWFMLIWAWASIYATSKICVYGKAFCIKQASPLEQITVGCSLFSLPFLRCPISYTFYSILGYAKEAACHIAEQLNDSNSIDHDFKTPLTDNQV